MIQTIGVIGATGMLGRPVTEELIRAGFSVRVLARNVAKAQAMFPAANVAGCDLRQPATLPNALAGLDALYLNLSTTRPERPDDFHTETDGLRHLLPAARQAGVQRIGYLSSLIMRYQGQNGFHWWAFDVKQEAVRLLRAPGLDYSIFYPSCFMESLLGTQRVGNVVLVVGRSPVKMWYVSAHDYGKQVAQAFRHAQPDQPQEWVIQGPEALTQQEAVATLVRDYKPARLRAVTLPGWPMRLMGRLSAEADYGWHITEALNKYPEEFEADRTWQHLGQPTITVKQFAENAM